jgi:chloride channel protein, CIC family
VYATVIDRFFPGAGLAPGAFALVAMGAVFGAASRAAFTFIIFAFEITRDYNSVLPLMLVTVIADGVAMLFMPKSSIMTEKLARRGLRIHQDYEADALQLTAVEETMDSKVAAISSEMRVSELADRIARHDPAVTGHQGVVILDSAGDLAGIITRGDVLRSLQTHPDEDVGVLDAGTRDVIVTYPKELLHEAANKMLRHNIGRLPVVHPENPLRVIGYLGRAGIMAARQGRMEEEHVREPGWIDWSPRRKSS